MILFKIILDTGTTTKAGLLLSSGNPLISKDEFFFISEEKYCEMKTAGTLRSIFTNNHLKIDLTQCKILQTEIICESPIFEHAQHA
jgi:hypothetical protein